MALSKSTLFDPVLVTDLKFHIAVSFRSKNRSGDSRYVLPVLFSIRRSPLRISPLHFGDQPFVSWHFSYSVLPSISYELTPWPSGWADFREDSLMPYPGHLLSNLSVYSRKNLRSFWKRSSCVPSELPVKRKKAGTRPLSSRTYSLWMSRIWLRRWVTRTDPVAR